MQDLTQANPVYIGKVRFDVRRDWNEKRRHNINPEPIIADGIHEAVITKELWDSLVILNEEHKEIPRESVKQILQSFNTVLSGNIDHGIRKRLLHLLIKEITIDKERNIDSIKIRLSDELIKFLYDNGGTPPDGAPSVFIFRELGIKSLELELVI